MKKEKIRFTLVAAVSAALVLGGCGKDDHDDHKHEHGDGKDTTPPSITINSPSADEYEKGNTIWIDVLITDNEDLHEAKWWVIKLPADTVYANKRHQHGKTIHIKDTYYVIPNEGGHSHDDYKFSVLAEDDNENTATKSHEFHVH